MVSTANLKMFSYFSFPLHEGKNEQLTTLVRFRQIIQF